MSEPPAFRVTHHRPDNSDPDRRIQGLAGPKGDGTGLWYCEIDYLIRGLLQNAYRLWTVDQTGKSVWVRVDENGSRQFLRTESDGIIPNNLLALPQV